MQEKKEPFSLAFLNFTPTSVEPPPSYHSVLAFPIAPQSLESKSRE